MKKTNVSLEILFVFFLIVCLAGCAVHTVHDESYVSGAISDRTGHELRWQKEEGVLRLPGGITLDDGLTEEEAVAIALWNNAQFQADLVALGFARADLIAAGMLRNPVLSLLFPLGPKQLEATLNLPIEFFWQRPKRVAAAKLDAEGIADSLIQHGLDLVRDVMIAYTELEFTRERARITAEEADLRQEIADIAVERLRVGDISGLEEAAIHIETARTRDASVRFARDAKLAEERLKSLLGLGLEETAIRLSPGPVLNELSSQPSDLLVAAFAARPDLRAAEIAIEAAGHRVGWERTKIFELTAMLDANGEGKEGFEMGPGIQMALPLLNQNNGRVARAYAELTQAARRYMAVKHRIALEVREALAQYLAAKTALKILQVDIMPAAATAASHATEAYSVGAISYLELLDFKRQLLQSRLREAEAKADFRRAEVNLEHSIGFKPIGE